MVKASQVNGCEDNLLGSSNVEVLGGARWDTVKHGFWEGIGEVVAYAALAVVGGLVVHRVWKKGRK